MSIRILAPEVSDQIAAGEVVERPASVIKELVENSIDAKAKNIEIRIESGGKKLIEIRDDGLGMTPEDAEKCALRHATSKIEKIDDLFSIQTFGFRGEALAAISSVSHFELVTKTANAQTGTKITLSGGRDLLKSPTPANTGTTIKVQDLFFPTPVRLAHLKTDETEYRQILREVTSFALANPDVGFKLFRDGKIVFDNPPGNLSFRTEKILGEPRSNLVEIFADTAHVKISGFIIAPQHCTKVKTGQFLFVNHRHVEDYKVAFALREAYAQSAGIERHLNPKFVLFIDIDPLFVDVNVHPRKTEVRFSEPGEIFQLVKGAAIKALQNSSAERGVSFSNFKPNFPKVAPVQNTHSFSFPSGEKGWTPTPSFQTPKIAHFSQQNTLRNAALEADEKQDLKLIGQIGNKYIVAEGATGIYIFDQHALHERERFEKLWKKYSEKKLEIQKLLVPQKIQLPAPEISLLSEKQNDLITFGFRIKFSDADTMEVLEVPAFLSTKNLTDIFLDFADFFENEKVSENLHQKLLRRMLEFESCRGSVMFGDKLKPEEMQKLLDEFQSTVWRDLCPHGRPNNIFLSFEEIDQKFHR